LDANNIRIFKPACMYISASKVKASEGMGQLHGGYVSISLARKGPIRFKELAHRLVLYAIHGPPPISLLPWDMSGPYVLHMCGHSDCLNPRCMCWGTAAENKRHDLATYHSRLVEQGRAHEV
jgi:hypothetical protein